MPKCAILMIVGVIICGIGGAIAGSISLLSIGAAVLCEIGMLIIIMAEKHD